MRNLKLIIIQGVVLFLFFPAYTQSSTQSKPVSENGAISVLPGIIENFFDEGTSPYEIMLSPTVEIEKTYNLVYQKPGSSNWYSYTKIYCYGTYPDKQTCESAIRRLDRRTDGPEFWAKECREGTKEDCENLNGD